MRDISSKQITLREAKAVAKVYCTNDTILSIETNQVPKGNIFEFARAAAFFAAKKTDQLLPHCHPVTIDGMDVQFELGTDSINILISVKSIGRTGIEMEALTAASIAALTIYDMLKPIDTSLSIGNIKLEEKKGGKSDLKNVFKTPPKCAILVCSDSTFEGKRIDKSGQKIKELLQKNGIKEIEYKIVPDEKKIIQSAVKQWVGEGVKYIFTTGGTGLGPRDNTVNAIKEILDKEALGIVRAMQNHGQMRTPFAMMSCMTAGAIGETMVVTLPGSTDGARESLEGILPALFHAHKMLKGGGH
jgi:molybdenum cofactor biosynthesis protein MoaC